MRASGIASHFLFRMAQSLFILYKRNYILYLEISKSSMPSEEVIPGAGPEFSAVNRRNWKSRPI